MYVDFEALPDHARVWIYQGNRQMTPGERSSIEKRLQDFTMSWAAHGNPLRTSFAIRNERFIILAVDEDMNDASGCSIDTSIHVLREIQQMTGIDFFSRNLIAFEGSEGLELILQKDLKQKYTEGVWQGHTLAFNTLASNVGELRNNWKIPAEKTWLKRYMTPNTMDSIAR